MAMSARNSLANLGDPALTIAGLELWIHGRQFPASHDFEDGNWLLATAHCGAHGASVRIHGPFLMTSDIERFGKQCEAVLRGEVASAVLESYEPDLRITLEGTDRLGHLRAEVEITPDQLTQEHKMDFELDQSFLPGIIRQCSAILAEYPVRSRTEPRTEVP